MQTIEQGGIVLIDWPAPGRPPVDQHDAALLDGLLEIVLGDRHHSHVRLLGPIRCTAPTPRFILPGLRRYGPGPRSGSGRGPSRGPAWSWSGGARRRKGALP